MKITFLLSIRLAISTTRNFYQVYQNNFIDCLSDWHELFLALSRLTEIVFRAVHLAFLPIFNVPKTGITVLLFCFISDKKSEFSFSKIQFYSWRRGKNGGFFSVVGFPGSWSRLFPDKYRKRIIVLENYANVIGSGSFFDPKWIICHFTSLPPCQMNFV